MLPARLIARHWRFSREAILMWLAGDGQSGASAAA
jgi:hypothetical protein